MASGEPHLPIFESTSKEHNLNSVKSLLVNDKVNIVT